MTKIEEEEAQSPYEPCMICHVAYGKHDPETFMANRDLPDDWWERIGPLTAHEIEALKLFFGPAEIPQCRMCGADLAPSSVGGGRPTIWRCSSPEADWLHKGFNSPEHKHYQESVYEQTRHGDSRVMRFIVQFERMQEGLRRLIEQDYDSGYSTEEYARAVLDGSEPMEEEDATANMG